MTLSERYEQYTRESGADAPVVMYAWLCSPDAESALGGLRDDLHQRFQVLLAQRAVDVMIASRDNDLWPSPIMAYESICGDAERLCHAYSAV